MLYYVYTYNKHNTADIIRHYSDIFKYSISWCTGHLSTVKQSGFLLSSFNFLISNYENKYVSRRSKKKVKSLKSDDDNRKTEIKKKKDFQKC